MTDVQLHHGGLTPSELRAVAELIDAGSIAETAKRLGTTPQTVKNLLLGARRRTRSVSTVQLVYRLAIGEFDPPWSPADEEGDDE